MSSSCIAIPEFGMFGFLLTSLLLEMTPGPNMTYLATVALAHGRQMALQAVAGVALGLTLTGCLAAFGLAQLLNTMPLALSFLRYAGIFYMLYLAYDIWTGEEDGAEPEANDFSSFRRGLIVNLLNPKAALFFISILPEFIDPAAGHVLRQNLLLVLVYVAVASGVHTSIVLFAARLRATSALRGNDVIVARVLSLGLVGVAAWLAWETR